MSKHSKQQSLSCNQEFDCPSHDRRSWLKKVLGITLASTLSGVSLAVPNISYAAALSREERDKMTPDQIIESFKQGNQRFLAGKTTNKDFLAQKRQTSAGQFPAAAILSCIDSRTPAEILLDSRIGDAFNARIAGNIANPDLIGSLEFACAVAGAKVILVMGHTACGAIMGAIDNVKLGNLTGLLERIQPAVKATQFKGEKTSKNMAFVDAVAKTNVLLTIEEIRKQSEILSNLEKDGKLKLVGSMYHLENGNVEFLP